MRLGHFSSYIFFSFLMIFTQNLLCNILPIRVKAFALLMADLYQEKKFGIFFYVQALRFEPATSLL